MSSTRRQFLTRALVAASTVLAVRPKRSVGELAAPRIKSEPDVVVYDGAYPGWPWITSGAQGRLYCVFREGTVHGYSASGRAMLATSDDQGRNWSKAAVIVDEPEVDDRNVAVVELNNGDLLATYNTYNAAKESQAMTIRSADGGRTWSEPKPLDRINTRTRSAVVVLRDGTLVLPYYVASGNGSLAAISEDGGGRWKTFVVPDAEGFVGDEWDLLEVQPGRLIGIHRNNHPQGDGTFWKTESRDGGRRWSVPRPTNIIDTRSRSPAQITMHGETPTVIYADRRMVSVSAVRTSDADFLQWDVEHRLPCYVYNADQTPIADGSYPVSAPVGDTRRLIVDYEIRETTKRIAGYFVDFPADW
jgi:Neuraminidase (sialidase)